MPSVTSADWRKWVQANDVSDPLVTLVEITHSALSSPIRISSDMSTFLGLESQTQEPLYGTVSNSNNYYAYPFRFTVPDVPEDGVSSKASFAVENVSRDLVATVRNLTSAPTITVKFVFASTPNVVQQTLPPMLLTTITVTAQSITGDLEMDDFRASSWPALMFYPSGFQGLFS